MEFPFFSSGFEEEVKKLAHSKLSSLPGLRPMLREFEGLTNIHFSKEYVKELIMKQDFSKLLEYVMPFFHRIPEDVRMVGCLLSLHSAIYLQSIVGSNFPDAVNQLTEICHKFFSSSKEHQHFVELQVFLTSSRETVMKALAEKKIVIEKFLKELESLFPLKKVKHDIKKISSYLISTNMKEVKKFGESGPLIKDNQMLENVLNDMKKKRKRTEESLDENKELEPATKKQKT